MVVWNNFQAALPSSAFVVAFSIFPTAVVSPFRIKSGTVIWWMGVEV